MLDLNERLRPRSVSAGLYFSSARGINDFGDIVAQGSDNHAYRLALVTLLPAALSFDVRGVGDPSSPSQAVTLMNSSSMPLVISSVFTSSDFEQTNDCGASLVAGANCTISVNFAPIEPGDRVGTLTVASPGVNHIVVLKGAATITLVLSASAATLAVGARLALRGRHRPVPHALHREGLRMTGGTEGPLHPMALGP